MEIKEQLPLAVKLKDGPSFDNYYVGSSADRGILVSALKLSFDHGGQFLTYLWGGPSSGKSHLLCAVERFALDNEMSVMTLTDYEQLESITDAVDQGLDVLIIDDVEQFLGDRELEARLFALYNQMRDFGKRWYVAASCAPRDLNAMLPDLFSRLAWGGIYKLPRLVDEELLEALRLRSNARGLAMSDEVGRYILYHGPRDAKAMFDALDSLDTASLAQQRKLSIPFIKAQLNW